MVWIIEDFSEHILVRLQAEVVETRETRGAEAKSVTTAQKAVNLLVGFDDGPWQTGAACQI